MTDKPYNPEDMDTWPRTEIGSRGYSLLTVDYEWLTKTLDESHHRLYTMVRYSPGESSRALVRVFVAPEAGSIIEITWAVAQMLKENPRETRYGYGIAVDGMQFNKAYHTKDRLQQALSETGFTAKLDLTEMR